MPRYSSMETSQAWTQSKYLIHLLIWNIFFALICIPTSGKMIDVFGIPLSISIFYFPFVYIIADVLTEVYGFAAARRVLWYTIVTQVIATLIFQFVVYYPPANTFSNDSSFRVVLEAAPQLVLFGTIAMFVGDISNNYVLAKLKILTRGKHLGLRFIISTLAGQSINTAIFYTFGLWGMLSTEFLLKSVIVGSIAKVAVEIVMLPMTIKISNWLKKEEKIDTFDQDTNFNPIKF